MHLMILVLFWAGAEFFASFWIIKEMQGKRQGTVIAKVHEFKYNLSLACFCSERINYLS